MTTIVLFVLIFLPLLVYAFAVAKRGVETTDPNRFFLAPGQFSSAEFANTSVAYGFQIASVSVFIGWGYSYGLGALVNPTFWGLGILFFFWSLNRIKPFLGRRQTLHGFLGDQYSSRQLRVFAACMTLLGFTGAFTAELVWGSAVLRVIWDNQTVVAVATSLMGAFIVVYIWRSGQVSVIQTDQYQLLFAHLGFLSLALGMITLLHQKEGDAQTIGLLLSSALAVILMVMCLRIERQRRYEATQPQADFSWRRWLSRPTGIIQVLVGAVVVCCIINAVIFGLHQAPLANLKSDTKLFDFSQGNLNLLSLMLLPMLWQFVDVTNWQRLTSVKVTDEKGNVDIAPIKLGLLRMAWESPASWVFAIILGVALRYADIGMKQEAVGAAMTELPPLLAGGATPFGQWLGVCLAGIFASGVLAAMLSTADTMLMGGMFTLVYDLVAVARKTSSEQFFKDHPQLVMRLGKIAAALLMCLGLGSYWLSTNYKFDLLSLLFGAFSAQVSLFPSVAGKLFLGGRAANARWAVASIAVGCFGGMITTWVALKDSSWQLYPPLTAIFLSVPVYLLGVLFSRTPTAESAASNQEQSFSFWLWVLVCVVSVGGAVHYAKFGDVSHFWIDWEVLSVRLTAGYALLVYIGFFFLKPRLVEKLKAWATGIVLVLFAAAILSLWYAIDYARDLSTDASIHVLLLLTAAVCFWLVNLVLNAGAKDEFKDLRFFKECRAAAIYCDWPTSAAFAVILTYVSILKMRGPTEPTAIHEFQLSLKAFIGGAVSFQLLLSNFIYGLQFLDRD